MKITALMIAAATCLAAIPATAGPAPSSGTEAAPIVLAQALVIDPSGPRVVVRDRDRDRDRDRYRGRDYRDERRFRGRDRDRGCRTVTIRERRGGQTIVRRIERC
jgi:hypothetical protein